ncbi:MAG: CHAT domain-containing protein [Rhodocyclales bacterium]|nr:CHAT domain-containing protein [Rhodocyclales bacterium]
MRFRLLIAAFFLLPVIPAFAQTPPVPPRNVADILAVLDQYKPDPAAVAKLRAQAEAQPPDTRHEQELAIFYHRRGQANAVLGNAKQQIADLERALSYVFPSDLVKDGGIGDRRRITLDLIYAEIQGGSWIRGIELSTDLAKSDRWGYGLSAERYLATAHSALYEMNAARKAAQDADARIARLRSTYIWPTLGQMFEMESHLSHGLLLNAEGNNEESERRLRKALELSELVVKQQTKMPKDFYRAGVSRGGVIGLWARAEMALASNLTHQGRSAEAEYYARSALLHWLQAYGRYSHFTALTVGVLGEIIYESGRSRESELLARAAIDSFERAGVASESVLLGEARSLLGASLAARSRWQDAIAVFEVRDKALASNPDQYAKIGGADLTWSIALLRTGDVKKSLAMVDHLYRKRLSMGLSETEYFTAQSHGFYAMALAADGQAEKALAEFQGAIPILLDEARRSGGGEQGGAVARQMRLVWILESYMKLLVDLRDSQLLKSAGIDAAAEAFRIADVARGSAVQRALAESAACATPSDPALAELARREQDAQQRFATLSDLLNRLLSAPPEQQLPEVIADLRRDIEALRVERDKLKLELAQRFPDYAELIAPKPTTIAQAQAALAADEALISIYVGAERSYVWAVPKTGRAAFAEVALTDAEAARQVAHLRKALDVGDVALEDMPRFDLAQSFELYRKLLQPVEAGWREAKNLIVVPHKALGQLPFAVLATAPFVAVASKGSLFEEYRKAPWLIRRAAVTQLPSVSTLLALRRMPAVKPGRKEFIGFGDPLFSNAMALAANDGTTTRRRFRNLAIDAVAAAPVATVADAPVAMPTVAVANSAGLAQLARLPDTAEEITSIARVLQADVANDVFLGRAASEKNVKSGQLDNRRIVMFATHGLVPGDLNGLTQPALALSAPEVTGNADEDGLLTMGKVLGLKLNADWVVLSACNTAAGDGAGSEAVSGLGKAFFFAGARTLLVSNWPVETVSAMLLTTKLFEHQATHPTVTRAEALRATMLDLMDRGVPTDMLGTKGYTYAHPMFWAPFSLVGDGGR